MKSVTDLEQGKKLISFGIDENTADFYWICGRLHTDGPKYQVLRRREEVSEPENYWPAWSLSALLELMPIIKTSGGTANPFIAKTPHNEYYCVYATLTTEYRDTEHYSDPIDAAFEMVVWLKENDKI